MMENGPTIIGTTVSIAHKQHSLINKNSNSSITANEISTFRNSTHQRDSSRRHIVPDGGGNNSPLSISVITNPNLNAKKGKDTSISRWHHGDKDDSKHGKKVGMKHQNTRSFNRTFMSQSSDHTPPVHSNPTTNRDMVHLMEEQIKNMK